MTHIPGVFDQLDVGMLVALAKLAPQPVLIYNAVPPKTLAMWVELLSFESGKPPFPVMEFCMVPPGKVSVADERSVPLLAKVHAARRLTIKAGKIILDEYVGDAEPGCAEGSD
jgi:hypothetical protein